MNEIILDQAILLFHTILCESEKPLGQPMESLEVINSQKLRPRKFMEIYCIGKDHQMVVMCHVGDNTQELEQTRGEGQILWRKLTGLASYENTPELH